jgi:hypothetical protein
MALAVQPTAAMNISGSPHRPALPFRRGLAAVALAALPLLVALPASAAPADGTVLPAEQHTSEKGRLLAERYAPALQALSTKIYHCMPWVEVKRNGIGFYKPKHLDGDLRYLSINLYIDQQPSPEFAAYTIEERASRMFSRYVGPLVRRMSAPAGLLTDPSLDGFTVILEWLKQVASTPEGRPIHETIAAFMDRATAAEYVAGRLQARDLSARARVLGWDGETALGPLRLTSWDDDFVTTYKVSNYQLAPGVSCP